MLIGITDRVKIKRHLDELNRALKPYITFQGERSIGFPGGNQIRTICVSSELGIWWYFGHEDLHPNKYWNAFGVENPAMGRSVSITVEINLPRDGAYPSYPGMWARDEESNIFLLHSGRIGGGKVGIGKSLFIREFKGSMEDGVVNGKVKSYASVLQLNDNNAPYQLATFIRKIRRLKDNADADDEGSALTPISSGRKEFFGIRKYSLPDEVTANCNHGIVFEELKKQLTGRGHEATNNIYLDLFTKEKGHITHIFEIKPALSRQIVYTAIGQLLLNSRPMSPIPQLIFVCPKEIQPELVADLQSLNIRVLKFQWQNKKPIFINLDDIV